MAGLLAPAAVVAPVLFGPLGPLDLDSVTFGLVATPSASPQRVPDHMRWMLVGVVAGMVALIVKSVLSHAGTSLNGSTPTSRHVRRRGWWRRVAAAGPTERVGLGCFLPRPSMRARAVGGKSPPRTGQPGRRIVA
ncbi:hypothetical protein [Nocardiopsis ansamitocini]|uniref:Uncharacterized protein n=1 Tax=Nocardiopsis ansamitocini TaxID=1670832 RepID=A0A9W6P8H0_9ACTN|nr:hypothetical protein [Nocardiopsis ansamitocini]GLU49499.1 hypothetical protein Nans01_38500 [Nocardiopsis ansamitocini]